jgi:hypothetical protein
MSDAPTAPLYILKDENGDPILDEMGQMQVDDQIAYAGPLSSESRPPPLNDPKEDPQYERARRARFR